MLIRKVEKKDAPNISAIYNYYVANTIITFEEEPVTVGEMADRIESISAKYPYIVLEDGSELIGYAYITEWKHRSAYRFSGEVTIYLQYTKTGKGAGTILFSALLDEIKKTNLHAIVGGIALPNRGSVALHEKFGFKKIGLFEDIGYKLNQWIDVGYWELKL